MAFLVVVPTSWTRGNGGLMTTNSTPGPVISQSPLMTVAGPTFYQSLNWNGAAGHRPGASGARSHPTVRGTCRGSPIWGRAADAVWSSGGGHRPSPNSQLPLPNLTPPSLRPQPPSPPPDRGVAFFSVAKLDDHSFYTSIPVRLSVLAVHITVPTYPSFPHMASPLYVFSYQATPQQTARLDNDIFPGCFWAYI